MAAIVPYDVVEVSYDDRQSWMQYATIKSGEEFDAIRLVERDKHQITPGVWAQFRIVDSRRNVKLT
jgi:hypothetical protein